MSFCHKDSLFFLVTISNPVPLCFSPFYFWCPHYNYSFSPLFFPFLSLFPSFSLFSSLFFLFLLFFHFFAFFLSLLSLPLFPSPLIFFPTNFSFDFIPPPPPGGEYSTLYTPAYILMHLRNLSTMNLVKEVIKSHRDKR